MSARTTRTRLFAATTVALAALALTACEGGSDTGAESGPSASTTATGQATPSAGASASTGGDKGSSGTAGSATGAGNSSGSNGSSASDGTNGSSNKGSSAGGNGGKGSGAEDDVPGKCSASDVRITAKKVSRPINHLLLTATNTGSKTCMLPPYPAARFGDAQAVPSVAESTKPQSLTGLQPGGSGYAGVLLSAGDGSGENGYEAKTLTVPFEDGSIATVSLPAGGVHVDSTLTVTYWQTDMNDALSY